MKVISLFACLAIGSIVETIAARVKRVGGGTQISIEQAPYIVSVRRARRHVCTGAFISTQHVLTAAYCVFNTSLGPLDDTSVVSGTDETGRIDVGHSIKGICLTDSFLEGKFWHDVAVITLSEHVEWNEKRNKIELPSAEQPCPEYATFTGFHTRSSKYAIRGLQQLQVQITPFNPVDDTHEYNQIFKGAVQLPGSLSSTDCGGPVVHDGKVIGIASVKSKAWYQYSYFVNVMKFEPSIRNCMEINTSSSSDPKFSSVQFFSQIQPPAKRRRL